MPYESQAIAMTAASLTDGIKALCNQLVNQSYTKLQFGMVDFGNAGAGQFFFMRGLLLFFFKENIYSTNGTAVRHWQGTVIS